MLIGRVYPKRIGPQTLTTSAVLYFTADKRYSIERFTVTNYSVTDANVTLHIVASGESVDDSNKLLGAVTVTANDLTTIPAPVVLDAGDKVYALASETSTLNLTFQVNDVEVGIQ